ncbi:MAG TPA: polysaccharide deacetylase family protein [Bacillota bacterium]
MRIFFLGQRQLRMLVILIIGLVFVAGIAVNWTRIARRVIGVRAGVSLDGHLVGGLLPNEVAQVVKGMAAQFNRNPRNATYFLETGEIIPEQTGRTVDVAATVNRICTAAAGSNLGMVVRELPPAITQEYFKPIYHGNENSPRVALAINVAWGEEYIPEYLKIFQAEKVKVTFFLVGTWVKTFPELVRKMAAAGHELANHGMYHGHPDQMGREDLKELIIANTDLIQSVIGKTPVKYFAPPYGEMNSSIVGTAGDLGYRTIMWSVDSIDWKRPAPDVLLERVLSKIEPGGIILLHPTQPTKEALPALIRGLRQKGLEPGTVTSVLQEA